MFAFLSLALLASIGLSSAQTGYSTTEYFGKVDGVTTYKGSSCKEIGFLKPILEGSKECTPCPKGMLMGMRGLACRSICDEYIENKITKVQECKVNAKKFEIRTVNSSPNFKSSNGTIVNHCDEVGEIAPATGNQCINCGGLFYHKLENICTPSRNKSNLRRRTA